MKLYSLEIRAETHKDVTLYKEQKVDVSSRLILYSIMPSLALITPSYILKVLLFPNGPRMPYNCRASPEGR